MAVCGKRRRGSDASRVPFPEISDYLKETGEAPWQPLLF
jgi:hypothetical protein